MKAIILSMLAALLIVGALIFAPQRQETSSSSVTTPANTETRRKSPAYQIVSNKTPLTLPLVRPQIVITKGERKLILFSDDKAVREYRVGLGFNPVDDKTRAGDGCTPEGNFYVCVKNAQSSYYLSLGLSYPNEEDAERGLRDDLITRKQYEKIVRAVKRKETPPWNTPLGGEIFIHGHGATSDWTLGCVALENEDMKELFDAASVGTPVIIKP